jgi:hypothetical protein
MSERGVFAVDRGIWDHPVLASRDPLSKREAWLWLISEAAWKPRRRRIGSVSIDIARGELANSVRFLAEAWGWPKSNVARFLEALKTETMIGTRTDQGLTVITICNYDDYQRVSLPDRDESGTASGTQVGQERDTCGTAAGQQRDKLEDNKTIEAISVAKATGAPAPLYTDSRHELWGVGVPILISLGVAEKQTRSMIGSWLKATKDDAQAVLGAIQRARDNRVHNPIPWITNSLKVPSHERNGSVYANTASDQSGSTAVLAGVAAAAERRARERRAAGQHGPQSRDDHVAERADPELFGAR